MARPTRTRPDGTKIMATEIRIEQTHDDKRRLDKLFPRGVTTKDALAKALLWLFTYEDRGLPRTDHILVEAFHAQTRGIYKPDAPEVDAPPLPQRPRMPKDTLDALINTTDQLGRQMSPEELLDYMQRLLGTVARNLEPRKTQ